MVYVAALALLIGLAVGALRGGSVARLTELNLRHPWLILLAFGAQALLFTTALERLLAGWIALVLAATNVALLIVVVLNRHLPGIKLFGIGLAANALVMTLNGGFMPASEAALRAAGLEERVATLKREGHSDKSRLIDERTRLGTLGDVIPVRPIQKVLSVGDLLIGAGAAWLVAAGMGTRATAATTAPAPAPERREV